MKKFTLYKFFDQDGTLLYVGQSVDAPNRLRVHARKKKFFHESSTITMENFENAKDLDDAEILSIKEEKPKYNIHHNNLIDCLPDNVIADIIKGAIDEAAKEQMRTVFDTVQLAEFLGISKQRLESWRGTSEGPPFVRIGRLCRYKREAVEKWMQENEYQSTYEYSQAAG